jgi:hypothetical protein
MSISTTTKEKCESLILSLLTGLVPLMHSNESLSIQTQEWTIKTLHSFSSIAWKGIMGLFTSCGMTSDILISEHDWWG